MAKLAAKDKFFDFSDYGRTPGTLLANLLKNTRFTPIHVTLLFGVCGLMAIYCILTEDYFLSGILLILKSILDATDGELARVKSTPSYTGRYLDSIFDILLNLLLFITIGYVAKSPIFLTLLAFAAVELQGTLYNFYYVILRNNSDGGDKTSKVFEYEIPTALPGETQRAVTILFRIYVFCYGIFDRIVYKLDTGAFKIETFPNWFMSFVSIYGLGFQLLIIAVMLSLGFIQYVIPFFIAYSIFIFVMIGIRKNLIKAPLLSGGAGGGENVQ